MVEAVAARDDGGSVAIVVWNGTVDVSKCAGDPLLDREIAITIDGLTAEQYEVRHRRLDHDHSDLTAVWRRMAAGQDWPDAEQWGELAAGDRLADLGPPESCRPDDGAMTMTFAMPMPAVSLIELDPSETSRSRG